MHASRAWDRIFSKNKIKSHFYKKIAKHPSVGLDRITTKKFEKDLDENIEIILRKVNNQTYSFTRYKQLLFTKGPSKYPRQICVPTVRDKLTLSLINEILYDVYGGDCRTEMPQVLINNIHQEIENFDSFIKIDISSFYASIDQAMLMKQLQKKVRKESLRKLIIDAIQTESIAYPVKEKLPRGKRTTGVPEGLPISNSLANIYLVSLDQKFKGKKDFRYYRYVDDILVLVKGKDLPRIRTQIENELSALKLKTNEKKDDGTISKGFEYLGYFINSKGVSVRKSSVLKFEQSLEELLSKIRGETPAYIEWKLNLKLSGFIYNENKYGWMFFYSQITDVSLLFHLDDLVDKLLRRYNLKEQIHCKKLVRVYHEITQALHTTKYIYNFDKYTKENMVELLSSIYKTDCSEYSEVQVKEMFNSIISKEVRNVERDIQAFS